MKGLEKVVDGTGLASTVASVGAKTLSVYEISAWDGNVRTEGGGIQASLHSLRMRDICDLFRLRKSPVCGENAISKAGPQ